jgi:hypothetical protein
MGLVAQGRGTSGKGAAFHAFVLLRVLLILFSSDEAITRNAPSGDSGVSPLAEHAKPLAMKANRIRKRRVGCSFHCRSLSFLSCAGFAVAGQYGDSVRAVFK